MHLLALLLIAGHAHAYEARHVFVANRGGNDVVEMDESLVRVRSWFAADGLSSPNGMAFTPGGEIWVADTNNHRILAFDLAGTRVLSLDTSARPGPFVESIYFGGDGTLYASANPGSGRVARWTIAGGDLPDVVSDPSFLNLANVNLTVEGNVVVSDFSGMNRGLRELDPDTGAILATFGTDLGRQEDVMIDAADRVFVSHYAAHEIVVFGPDRAELFRFTTPATEAVPLAGPTGIVLTHDCRILVAGFSSNRIYEWHHEGAAPPTYVGSVAVEGVTSPESLAIAGLSLPGSFDEFGDHVPTCDPIVMADAGPRPDAGGGVDAGAIERDAGGERDAGARPPRTAGCGCRAGTDGATWSAGAVAVLLACVGRRRARRARRRSPRGSACDTKPPRRPSRGASDPRGTDRSGRVRALRRDRERG